MAATYGDSDTDLAVSIQQTNDGRYFVLGMTMSFSNGQRIDIWILKLDSSGNIQWQKTYGGLKHSWAQSIQIAGI